MRLATGFLLLCAATASAGQPPTVTEVPAPAPEKWQELSGKAGKLMALESKPPASWVLVDDLVGELRQHGDGGSAYFTAPTGRYRVLVVSAMGPPARLLLVIGESPAPTPPRPNPDPPRPVSPLVGELRAAYLKDGGKPAEMGALAALYRLMVVEAVKPEYATPAALNGIYLAARDSMLGNSLPAVRRRLGSELLAVIPPDPESPLTAEIRTRLAATYSILATAVEDATK